jgi:nitrate reductase gamma subunit
MVFWVLIAASTLGFLVGLADNASIWLSGRIEGMESAGKWARSRAVGAQMLRSLFSRSGSRTLTALVLDGMLHRRLYATNKARWLAHTALSLGFLTLFALSIFTGFFEQILRNLGGVRSSFVESVINKDTPVMAVLNESLGVLLVAGLSALIVRRYAIRPKQLRTLAQDTWIIVLLGIGLLTAYPLEALRFLAAGLPVSSGWFSYIGYPLALVFRPLVWPWEPLHTVAFFVHVLPFMALLVYMPYSKFLHLLVSPVVGAANSLEEEEPR